ncbi:MAG: CvpA family protein [Kiritimatiellales bacterium]|nr:CvpA family protein [Kiritimatiellales bacterium]
MVIDMIAGVLVLLFAVFGCRKGLSGEIAHIVALLALAAGLFFIYPHVYHFIYTRLDQVSPHLLMWLLLMLLVVLAFFCLGMVTRLLAGMLKAQFSAGADKFFGFVFGFVRGTFLVAIVMIFMGILGPPRLYDMLSGQSVAGRFVCYKLIPRVQPHFDRLNVKDKVNEMRGKLKAEEQPLP